MSVRIICDSTCDLTPALKERVDITHLTVHFGEEDFIDGVELTAHDFYEKLASSDVMPSTSQATPFAFGEAFEAAVNEGHEVVCITCSSGLSGTYQSAVIAAGDFDGKVYVVDSRNIALSSAIMVEYALRLADEGKSAAAIAEELTAVREKVHLFAVVDTLEYLQRGGRVSKAVAIAGGMLNIKPVITVADGEIKVLGKARGSRQGNNLLVQEIEKAGGVDFSRPLMLGYTGLSDALLQKYMVDSAAMWEGKRENLPCSVIGSVVGTHAGPGAVAVAFFASDFE